MRNAQIRLVALGVAGLLIGLAGCTVNPPLMFGDSANYGLQIGSDAGGTGTSMSVGYRHRSLAVVPVSVLDAVGSGQAIGASNGDDRRDALSVFASFENTKKPGSDEVDVGQIFATGSAAQFVSNGIRCKLHSNGGCTFQGARLVAMGGLAVPAQSDAVPKPKSAARKPVETAPTAQGDPKGPYQAPLFYGRTDTLGIGIGQSTAEGGAQFDLGYTVRNIALIPAYTRGRSGEVKPLISEAQGDGDDESTRNDALSVLGQFQLNTQTRDLGLDLTRYFATGIAAQYIAAGLYDAFVQKGQEKAAAASAVGNRAAATLAQAAPATAP